MCENIAGRKFGSLTVLSNFIIVKSATCSKRKWLCRCDCGNEFYVFRDALLRRIINYCPKCKPSGVRNTKLYHIYHGIIQRCENANNPSYAKYGKKGISICSEWRKSYDAFKKWAENTGYEDGLTIDRLDSSSGYNTENCRWISLSENSARANYGLHKNRTKLVDVFAISPAGIVFEIINIKQFARENGLNYSNVAAALHGRIPPLYCGWRFHSNKTRN